MGKIKILGEEIEYSDDFMLIPLVKSKYDTFAIEWEKYLIQLYKSKISNIGDFICMIGQIEYKLPVIIVSEIVKSLKDDGYKNIDEFDYYDNYFKNEYIKHLTDIWNDAESYIEDWIDSINELFDAHNDKEARRVVNAISLGEWDRKTFGMYTDTYIDDYIPGDSVPVNITALLKFLRATHYCDHLLTADAPNPEILLTGLYELVLVAMQAEINFIEKRRGYPINFASPLKSADIIDSLKDVQKADSEVKKLLIEAINYNPLNMRAYILVIRLFGDKDGEVDAAVRQLEIKDLYENKSDENHPHRGEFTYKEGLLYEILENSNVNTYQELLDVEQEINEKSQFYGVDIPSKITSVLHEARAILEKQDKQERAKQEEKKQREREEEERLKQEEERKQREHEEQERIRREAEQKRLAEEEEKRKQEESSRIAEENERKRLEAERIRKEQEEQERLEREEQKKIKEQKAQERALIEEEKKRKSEALPITNKSKIAALILSILFGWLGIDRFYLGHIVTGIIKLITGGGFGVWWLIDVILIVSDILTPKDGRYMTRKGLG